MKTDSKPGLKASYVVNAGTTVERALNETSIFSMRKYREQQPVDPEENEGAALVGQEEQA